MNKKNNSIFIILGMHRSGTSLVTKFLEIFNINIGSDFSSPRSDNPTGFYEDMSFFRVNMNLLELNKIEWNEILNPLNLNLKTKTEKINFWLSDIEQKVKFNCNFAFKDPRSILFINFWNSFFKKKNYFVRFLYCFRHPYLISKSIMKRDKMKRGESFLFILQNWYLILKNIKKNDEKIFLDYDLLILDSKKFCKDLQKKSFKNLNNDKYLFFQKKILNKKNQRNINFKIKNNQVYDILLEIYHYFKKPKRNELLKLIKKIEKYYQNIN